MFDFDRWMKWLEARADDLEEFEAEFSVGRPSPKLGCAFNIRTNATLSQMRIWITGEAEFSVFDLRSNNFVYHSSDLMVDDATFETVFQTFFRYATAEVVINNVGHDPWVEVGRKAHELRQSHGRNAHSFAAKLAEVALAEGAVEEHQFWKSVEGALTPR